MCTTEWNTRIPHAACGCLQCLLSLQKSLLLSDTAKVGVLAQCTLEINKIYRRIHVAIEQHVWGFLLASSFLASWRTCQLSGCWCALEVDEIESDLVGAFHRPTSRSSTVSVKTDVSNSTRFPCPSRWRSCRGLCFFCLYHNEPLNLSSDLEFRLHTDVWVTVVWHQSGTNKMKALYQKLNVLPGHSKAQRYKLFKSPLSSISPINYTTIEQWLVVRTWRLDFIIYRICHDEVNWATAVIEWIYSCFLYI